MLPDNLGHLHQEEIYLRHPQMLSLEEMHLLQKHFQMSEWLYSTLQNTQQRVSSMTDL